MAIQAGNRVGPYEIVCSVGAGGMGQVFRARDTRLGRDVAIKVLPDELAAEPDRVRRFEQEARAIAALNHPNICQIYDVVPLNDTTSTPGSSFLVLEHVNGEPLRGPLRPADAVRLAVQVADALDAAHQHGILHRDVKPANIMVTSSGQVKVLDFGLATTMTTEQDLTRTTEGMVVGTVAYMSPEQVEGKPLDARSDIFSFGATLYEMLSGRRAFSGDSAAQVVSAVLRDDPPALGLSPALEHVVRRCLAKQRLQRFASMQEVKAALEGLSGSAGVIIPSIAVLPFENMSGEKENEYFSDGLAEEILNLLARIPALKVIARTSAFAFKEKRQDIREIASALGVSNVLEGSVRKSGSRVRVSAQLIAAADGSRLWSERYDRELADVFAVQDEIAAAIADALQITLSASTRPRRYTPNLPAYDNYLKALHDSEKWTPQSLAQSRSYLERASALDPEFALAHAELANVFHRLAIYGLMPPREALRLVREQAARALAIDPSLPEGHAMLGTVAAMFDYDWKEAERHFTTALSGEAVPPLVHRYYAHYCLLPVGRAREAVTHHDVAIGDDPLNLTARSERALALYAAGQSADSNQELRRILEIDDTLWFPYFVLGQAHLFEGRLEEALPLAEQAHRAAPWFLPGIAVLAVLLERRGDTERAETLAARLRADNEYIDPIGPATYHLHRGELDAAADWIAKAIEQRQPAVFFIVSVATALRSSPRWPALARRMRLPATSELS